MNASLPEQAIALAIAELKALLGERASTGASVLDLHAIDGSHHDRHAPQVVVTPVSTEEVAEVVRIAARHRVPITPYGAGSGLEGGAIPVHGGISLDTVRLDSILEIRADDMIARVGAGVRRLDLNHALRATGLFFPIDPGANASIGGMTSTGASGTNAVRYGVMRENVLGLTVVTADGTIVKTGSLARKSSSGYDLTRLFVGSEGTLGIVTEIVLRLHPIPDAATAHAGFETLAGAVNAVTDIKRLGIAIGRVELLDRELVEVINRRGEWQLPALPTLFFEFQGTQSEIEAQSETIAAIVTEHGGTALQWPGPGAGTVRLWETRRDALSWAKAERPGSRSWPSDVCVPTSALAGAILQTREDVNRAGLTAYIVGHVGDGNFHCVFKYLPDESKRVSEVSARIVERAIAVGGTASGEHGIGLGKRKYLAAEHGVEAITLMRNLKSALDPLGILNPGKVLPDPSEIN